MFDKWIRKSVYIGRDLREFHEIRDLLDVSGIRYDHKVKNHQGQFLAPGRGTIRGGCGSLGADLNQSYEYEITVSASDEEQAVYVIRNRKNS